MKYFFEQSFIFRKLELVMKNRVRVFWTTITALCLVFALFCGPKPDYVGTWEGEVLIVDVEYRFTMDKFESRTYSLNKVMIHSAKGDILSVKDGRMEVLEKEKYVFNSSDNTGKWAASDSKYSITYKITGNKIQLQPSSSRYPYMLIKQ